MGVPRKVRVATAYHWASYLLVIQYQLSFTTDEIIPNDEIYIVKVKVEFFATT